MKVARLVRESARKINAMAKAVPVENFFERGVECVSSQLATLRQVQSPLISVECNACDRREHLDRKGLVKRYGASVRLDQLRRRLALGCERMTCADGVDRCQTRLVGLSNSDGDR